MRSRGTARWLALLLAAGLLTTGCIGLLPAQDDGATPTTSASTPPEEGANLAVEVTDPTLRPLPGATVELSIAGHARTDTTDPTGQAVFEGLPSGPALLEVRAPHHLARQVNLQVPGDGTSRQSVILAPETDAAGFIDTLEFHGYFECSASALIVTGDCFATARALAEDAGVPFPEDTTNERFVLPFEVHPGWTQLRVTQRWEDPEVGLGSMMRVNLEPRDQNNTEGHGDRFARAEGTSPISLTVRPGQAHKTASAEDLAAPASGGTLQTRTFHVGTASTHHPGGTAFLGTGTAIQQAFTVYVEVAYGAPLPEQPPGAQASG